MVLVKVRGVGRVSRVMGGLGVGQLWGLGVMA